MPIDDFDINGASVIRNKKAWLYELGNRCIAAWKARVREELPNNALKEAYLQQLSVIDVTEETVTFGLPGGSGKQAAQASIAENGMTAHDMNDYLTKGGRTSWILHGRKATDTRKATPDRLVFSKKGPVAFVPMEKSKEKIEAQTPRGDAMSAQSSAGVLKALGMLAGTKTKDFRDEGGRIKLTTEWGGRLGKGYGQVLKETHKHDALYRMMKLVAFYKLDENQKGKIVQGEQFKQWRTVTRDGARWHRVATPAANIADKVLAQDVPGIQAKIVQEMMSE